MRLTSWVLVSVLVLPRPGMAQGGVDGAGSAGLEATAFAGSGMLLRSSSVWGVGAELPVLSALALAAEYSRWRGGTDDYCIPEAPVCGVRGWSVLAGLRLRAPERSGIRPFGEILGGRHARRGSSGEHAVAALALGAGTDVRVGWSFRLRLGLRYLRPFDDAYAALAQERLSYTVATVGLTYGIRW